MADSQRLFFALWPDATVRQRIAVAGTRATAAAGGRPVPPENYHLTLAFLGSVPAEHLPALLRVARAIRMQPFSLALDHTGYWPRPRVAWLRPAVCPAALQQLVDDLWGGLAPLGFAPDSRTFKPHVSLVRKAPGGLGSRLAQPIVWAVDDFVLVRSETLPAGPVYSLLERFPATV